jgi:hypothetical protein
MNALYFDIEEDDEVEETVWTEESGFLENGFDVTTLQSDLDFMRSYK